MRILLKYIYKISNILSFLLYYYMYGDHTQYRKEMYV